MIIFSYRIYILSNNNNRIMRTSPGPKYRLVSKGYSLEKTQKQYMKTLQKDVQKSKVAVENITTFTFTEQQLRKKIDDIQNQLRGCVTKIHTQVKKQKVLAQLISLLKGEMLKYQTTQKKEEERVNTNHEKLVKKINYDVEQILQKHNEQIARISLLKEQASSRRSERVVYSNLFKKLQKQIKYYEEIYKEQLMKSETAIRKRPEEDKKSISFLQKVAYSIDKDKQKQKDKRKYQTVTNKSELRQSILGIQPGENPFITVAKEEELVGSTEKRIKQMPSLDENKLLSEWDPHQDDQIQYNNSHNNKEITKDINHYINFLEKIKIYTECSSAREILEHYSTIESQSQQMTKEIELFNQGIMECKCEQQKIIKKLHQEQFAYRYTIRLNEGPLPKEMIEREQKNRNKQENIKQMLECIEKVSQILDNKIKINFQEKKLPPEEHLKILDMKIDMISSSQKYPLSVNRSKDETVMSENMVDCLLQKMDKFNDCERILDKNLFKQEYYKELVKGKRGPNKTRKF